MAPFTFKAPEQFYQAFKMFRKNSETYKRWTAMFVLSHECCECVYQKYLKPSNQTAFLMGFKFFENI